MQVLQEEELTGFALRLDLAQVSGIYLLFVYFLYLLYLCILRSLAGINVESLDVMVWLSCCPAPPLKLIDLPGLDSRSSSDDSPVSKMPLQLSPFQYMCMGTRKIWNALFSH